MLSKRVPSALGSLFSIACSENRNLSFMSGKFNQSSCFSYFVLVALEFFTSLQQNSTDNPREVSSLVPGPL